MIKLTDKAFYLDFKHDKICSGIVVGHLINESGFETMSLKGDNGTWPILHAKFVFASKEEAEKAFASLKPLNDKIKAIKKEADKQTDDLLEQLCGVPAFKSLTVSAAQKTKNEE